MAPKCWPLTTIWSPALPYGVDTAKSCGVVPAIRHWTGLVTFEPGDWTCVPTAVLAVSTGSISPGQAWKFAEIVSNSGW